MSETITIAVGFGFVCVTKDHPEPFVIGPFTDEPEGMAWLSNIRQHLTEDIVVFGGTSIMFPAELTAAYSALRKVHPHKVGNIELGPGMFSEGGLRPEDLDG